LFRSPFRRLPCSLFSTFPAPIGWPTRNQSVRTIRPVSTRQPKFRAWKFPPAKSGTNEGEVEGETAAPNRHLCLSRLLGFFLNSSAHPLTSPPHKTTTKLTHTHTPLVGSSASLPFITLPQLYHYTSAIFRYSLCFLSLLLCS
jgi:hypothetical protein